MSFVENVEKVYIMSFKYFVNKKKNVIFNFEWFIQLFNYFSLVSPARVVSFCLWRALGKRTEETTKKIVMITLQII